MESATSWTLSQPCGMKMLTNEHVTNAMKEVATFPSPQCKFAHFKFAKSRLEISTPRQRHPLSSGPTSVWRQPSLFADLRDKVRVDRPEHKALFAYRKRLEVPNHFDGSERGQEHCLSQQEFQFDWVQRLKGVPLKSSQDNREVPRGHKGWPGGIHPPGTLQEPHNEIMLSQGLAVHCILVGRYRGHIHFQGGGWKPTLQSILQERKHFSNCAYSGVFPARTPVREQTPLQCIDLPCWRSSSLIDGLYHCQW